MKMLRKALFVSAILFSIQKTNAQFHLPAVNSGIRIDLEKVIADFPKQFASLKGEVMVQNPQTIQYASLLNFSGSEESSIIEYSAARPMYSWQATMLTTESYEEASKKYKALCSQVKGMTIKLSDYTFSLTGDYEAPEESRIFSTSVYHLLPAATNLPKMKVEVSMQYSIPEWKVSLTVYDKEREDQDRGSKKDE
jgi:hypothetical protein